MTTSAPVTGWIKLQVIVGRLFFLKPGVVNKIVPVAGSMASTSTNVPLPLVNCKPAASLGCFTASNVVGVPAGPVPP